MIEKKYWILPLVVFTLIFFFKHPLLVKNYLKLQVALTLCVFCFSWKFAQSEISINTSFTLCYSYILSKVAAQSVKRTKWNRTMWGLPVQLIFDTSFKVCISKTYFFSSSIFLYLDFKKIRTLHNQCSILKYLIGLVRTDSPRSQVFLLGRLAGDLWRRVGPRRHAVQVRDLDWSIHPSNGHNVCSVVGPREVHGKHQS